MCERRRSSGTGERSTSSRACEYRARAVENEIQLDAAAAEVVEHLRAVDVRGGRPLRDLAGAVEDGDRLADLAQVHARPRFGEEGAQGELGSGHRVEGRGERRELGDGLLVPAVLDRGLGARRSRSRRARARSRRRRSRGSFESTPSRADSHSMVSAVGRVFPRSIWLTYSLEKRSPARSVCVSPRAIRSCLTRPPRVGRDGAWVRVRAAFSCMVNLR